MGKIYKTKEPPTSELAGLRQRVAELEISETELKQAEEKLQTILETAIDGFWLANLEGKTVEVNDSYCKMVGYTREELLEMSISDLEAIESPEEIAQHIKKIKEQGYDRFESQHKRKDGNIIDVEVSVNYLDLGEGQFFVFARDITERKQMGEALQAEKNKLKSIIDALADGLSIQDKDYNIIYQSEPTRIMYGHHVGEKCYRVYESKEKVCDGCPVEKAFKDGKSHISERKSVTSSGEVIFSENKANPIRDARGEVVSCLEVGRDITERKQMEEALRESEEKYKELAESITDIFFAFDKDLRYTYWNKASEQLTGISAEDALGKHLYDIFPDSEMTKRAERGYLKALGTQQVQSFVNEYHIGGRDYFFEISAYPSKNGLSVFVKDITERKRIEEALQAEKNKLKSIIDALEYDLTIQDKDFNIIYQNEPSRISSGGDHMGEKCYRVYEGRDKICDGCPVKKAFKDGKSHTEERKRLSPSGEITFWENTANPIRDARGEIVSCLEIGRNITGRKQMEEALKESQEKLERMFESVTEGISVIDLNGIITEANQRTAEMHGFGSKDELLGKSAFELVAPSDHEKIAKNMSKALKQGTVRDQEYTLLKSDGSEFPGELSTSLLKDALGNPVGHVTISRDITDRKQAEQALRESEEFSSSLLTNSPNPMLVINQDTSVRYVNPALYRLTGFSSTEVIGRKAPYPWWTEETLQKTSGDLKEAMRKGAVRLEELFQKKNGEHFWVEITSAPVTSDGEFKYYLANWVDITEQKQAEEREKELQQELHISSRLASIGELAAGVAHQINNPLTGVLGFSQRLLRKSTDQEISQDLGRIYIEAERAAKVVQNLLTFARRREPKKQYSDINEILQSALELRAYELKTSNIEVVTDLAPGLPQIMVDFYQIQEAFLNIILNAEQAMTAANSGGRLTIKTEERKGHIRTTFADDGPGIPAEHLDKLFDPFFSTRGERGGTGLGLSVCHGIISEHGGRIYAKSKPGKGATFFVELPLPVKTSQEVAAPR